MFENLLPQLRRKSSEIERPASVFDLMDDMMRRNMESFPAFRSAAGQFPSVDVREDDSEIAVQAELPGVKPEDIDISVQGDTLVIRGEKKFEEEEKRENYTRIERSYGSFHRTFRLPSTVNPDAVKARFEGGVLKLSLPKSEEAKARKVQIES